MGLLLFWVAMAMLVAFLASQKGRTTHLWFLYGLFIWPIALVHVVFTSQNAAAAEARTLAAGDQRKCPACAELVKREAVICRYCRTELAPLSVLDPARTVATPEPMDPADAAAANRRAVKAGVAVLGVAILATLVMANRERAADRRAAEPTRTDQYNACVDRGIAYFESIKSYPVMSDGRRALDVARKRCDLIPTAF